MTPTDLRSGRSTDASRLTFPIQLVILVVSCALAVYGATISLRSDVRDILTRMAAQTEIDKANNRLLEERAGMQKDAIADLARKVELQKYELQSVKEMVIRQGVKK